MNAIDTMERYKIQASIKNAIGRLDSVPIRRDLIPEASVVQLTDLMADAHLAIEKGLKALISTACGTPEPTHALNRLHRDLRNRDANSADYLAAAFEDAVDFHGYNLRELGHLRSLDDYLSKAGTESAFEEFRYWAIEGTRRGQSAIPYVQRELHRELLRALWCLFTSGTRETVSQRVEREVREAMFSRRHISYGSNDKDKEHSVRQYKNWLFEEHSTCCSALKEALRLSFSIDGQDEFASESQREAFNDLRQSKDPAVQYYVGRLTYLPKGSQWQIPGAKPRMKWSNKEQTAGLVETPAGTWLGSIEKYADGGWGIDPTEGGLARIAESAVDAKHHLTNHLTKQVTVTVKGNLREMRIVSVHDFFLALDAGRTYEVEFWDANHGLHPGEQISIELLSERHQGLVNILEGTITGIEQQRVTISGMAVLHARRDT